MPDATPSDDDRQTLNTRSLTWTAVLGRWVDFARSAVALPDDATGQAMKASVPDIIMLQAVWFALQDLSELPADQRALGIDRAAVLIERHRSAIERRWRRDAWPGTLSELVRDVEQLQALRAQELGSPGQSS